MTNKQEQLGMVMLVGNKTNVLLWPSEYMDLNLWPELKMTVHKNKNIINLKMLCMKEWSNTVLNLFSHNRKRSRPTVLVLPLEA